MAKTRAELIASVKAMQGKVINKGKTPEGRFSSEEFNDRTELLVLTAEEGVQNLAGSASDEQTVVKAANDSTNLASLTVTKNGASIHGRAGDVTVDDDGVNIAAGNSGFPNATVKVNGQPVATQQYVSQAAAGLSENMRVEDGEDLMMLVADNGRKELKLADKAYAPAVFSGLGRKYLRKNYSAQNAVPFNGFVEGVTVETVGTTSTPTAIFFDTVNKWFVGQVGLKYYSAWQGNGDYEPVSDTKTYVYNGKGYTWNGEALVEGEAVKNVLTQAMVNTANTIYHIQYDYDLNGETITLPAGCVLEFNGGSLANGFLNLNNAELRGDVNITAEPAWDETNEFWEEYKPSNLVLNVSWFGAKADGVSDDAPAIKRCIKWLHKNGATMVFDLKGTYILGDGVKDLTNDPNMTLHTGYSYDPTSAVLTGDWTGISNRKDYIAAHPANIGRDISLTFFRFTNLTIEGNGVTIKSHDGNGYCKHNELFRFYGCDYLNVRNITIDANRDNRPDTWDCLGDYGFGTEVGTYQMLMSDSLYDVLQLNNTWGGGVGTREISTGYRQVQNLVLVYCNFASVDNVISIGSLMDGLNFNGYTSYSPHDLFVKKSTIEHSSRHNLTMGGANACVIEDCVFQYAGLKEDETTELWMSTCSNIDLEGETDTVENIVIRNCVFRKTAKNAFVITRDTRYCLIDGCRFEGSGVNPRYNQGCFKNEIKNCTFINCTCPFYQEGINVHHNQFIFEDYAGSIIDFVEFNYDPSFVYGKVSGNKASIVPSRFCNNYIECTWTKSATATGPLIRVEGNYEINDNVFVNVQGHSSLNAIMAFCKSFVGNKFIRDTETYPWLVGSVNPNAWTPLEGEINIESIEDGVTTNVYGYKSQLKANGCVEYYITRNAVNNPFWMQLSGIKAEIEIFSAAGSSVKAHYYKTSKGGWDGVFGTYENTNSAITFTGYYHHTTAPYIKIESLSLINIHIVIYQQNKKTIDNAIILSTAPSTSGYQTFKDVNPVLSALPSYNKWIESHAILSKNLHKMCIKAQGDGFYTHDGWPATYATRGTTAQRPTPTSDMDGFEYYDTTLHLFIHWDGTQWVNATGTAV